MVQLKMREVRFWPKMKFETIFFQVLWQFSDPKWSLPRAEGGLGGEIPPTLQILGEICSDFFESTSLVGKSEIWLALAEDEPTKAFPNWRREWDSNPRVIFITLSFRD